MGNRGSRIRTNRTADSGRGGSDRPPSSQPGDGDGSKPIRCLPAALAAPLPIAPNVGRVLRRPTHDVRTFHTFGREIGRGQFGITYLVTHNETGKLLACKSIATRRLLHPEDIEDVRREVQIMHHLTGHRNIVELEEAYEDRHSVNLVMELCEGGELFDRIIARGHYSERAAAALCREIVTVVHVCHSMGVMHRDLKPENFLFLNMSEDSPLKATDFGLSTFFKPGKDPFLESVYELRLRVCGFYLYS